MSGMMARRGCCGLKLRTISLTLGIIFLIISCILLICTAEAWVRFSQVFQLQQGHRELSPEVMVWFAQLENFLFLPLTVFFLLSMMFNSLLIHGARRSLACAVVAWLIFYGIVFAISILISVGLLFVCAVAHTRYVQLQTALDVDIRDQGHEALEAADLTANLFRTVALACGVLGALGLLVNVMLWYWFALVRAFLSELLNSGNKRETTKGDGWMAAMTPI